MLANSLMERRDKIVVPGISFLCGFTKISYSKEGILVAVSTNENGVKILANTDGTRLLRIVESRAFDPSRVGPAWAVKQPCANASDLAQVVVAAGCLGAKWMKNSTEGSKILRKRGKSVALLLWMRPVRKVKVILKYIGQKAEALGKDDLSNSSVDSFQEGKEDVPVRCRNGKPADLLPNSMYAELWKACAGPFVDIPRNDERVYYFLEGHLELHLRYKCYYNGAFPSVCWQLDCKILTASDTSSNGVFSVLRKHATECLPQRTLSSGIRIDDVHGISIWRRFTKYIWNEAALKFNCGAVLSLIEDCNKVGFTRRGPWFAFVKMHLDRT